MAPPVLTTAIALRRIEVGGYIESQPWLDNAGQEIRDEDDNVVMHDVNVPVYAEPGEEVDVSEWANVDAYVRQGWIQLLTPDIEVKVNRPEKTTGTGVKPRTQQRSQQP
jgi:hypothetical protein